MGTSYQYRRRYSCAGLGPHHLRRALAVRGRLRQQLEPDLGGSGRIFCGKREDEEKGIIAKRDAQNKESGIEIDIEYYVLSTTQYLITRRHADPWAKSTAIRTTSKVGSTYFTPRKKAAKDGS